ncbi:MAG TPA: hypothetical protein VGO13_04970 [Solirubrobacterales bacterium]|nr:hypothetical protein [Solirubrobacterales bacterium]
MSATDRPPIAINPSTEEAKRLWAMALDLAEAFGVGAKWTLVGGLMVQLHGFEHHEDSRPTIDIDVLGDSRQRPAMTKRIAEILLERGGEIAMPPRSNKDLGYRFEIDGEIVEILGPEGLREDPNTLGKLTTFQVPGGTQALKRTETVPVSLDGQPARELRQPNLLGAILIKARVMAKEREKFESDREDLIRLLSFVEDPRALAEREDLLKSERRWLKKIEKPLDFSDRGLANLFTADTLARSRQAFALLIA